VCWKEEYDLLEIYLLCCHGCCCEMPIGVQDVYITVFLMHRRRDLVSPMPTGSTLSSRPRAKIQIDRGSSDPSELSLVSLVAVMPLHS